MNYETIQYETGAKICTITLNRPAKRNAFNALLVSELKTAFTEAENADTVKIIILKGAGEVFSAGADLAYLQTLQKHTHEENIIDSANLMQLYKQIYTLSKIVVAQIEGAAIAGGCGLATVCDFAFAVPEARFGYTEVRIGFIPSIVMVFLLRKISEGSAKTLLLTGKLIDAEEARACGLINAIVKKENIAPYVLNFCNDLIENCSRESLKSTKQMIAKVQELSLDEALQYAVEINVKARESEDCRYGIQSFLEKKKTEWK